MTKQILGYLLLFTIARSSIAVPEGGTIRGAKQHDRTQESRKLSWWASLNAAAERKKNSMWTTFTNSWASVAVPEEEEAFDFEAYENELREERGHGYPCKVAGY